MARSIWKNTLVAGLAWASFGWAQEPTQNFIRPSSGAASSARPEQVITVQESGQPSHKCRVVKSWHAPDGIKAYQVQALDSGEMMTVVESGPITSVAGSKPGTRVQAVATRIYHWSKANVPPADAPRPPADALRPPAERGRGLLASLLKSEPKASAAPIKFEPQLGASPVRFDPPVAVPEVKPEPQVSAPTITSAPATADGERPSLLSKWRSRTRGQPVISSPDASRSSQICEPCVPSESQPTRLTMATGTPATLAGQPCCEPATSSPRGQQLVMVMPGLKLESDTSLVTQPAEIKDSAASRKDTLSDWRKSWGKPDTHRSERMDEVNQSRPILPAADDRKPDPLQLDRMTGSDKSWKNQEAVGMAPAKGQQLPPGSQSVVGAGNAMGGQVQFVPVPIVTTPDLRNPPMPPMRAPQPVMQYGAMANANPASKALGPNMTTTDEGMVNAFTSMPSREAVAQATNAFSNGEGATGGSPTMPAGTQAAYPRSPYSMMARTAPNMAPASPMSHAVTQVGYQDSMPANSGMQLTAAEQQMMAALHNSLYPSQREWAAEGLATFDWHAHPEVVQALVTAARQDPAATVRAACVHFLAKMNIHTMVVIDTVQKLRSDPDVRVRQEVDQALMVLRPDK